MDINMPEMDGFQTTLWLKKNHPTVNVLALSMYDDENAIIRMIKNGAQGYILKEAESEDLKRAIDDVVAKGFHYSEKVTGRFIHSIQQMDALNHDTRHLLNLSEKELEFLKWVATEYTYKEIAAKMYVSPRTIDGYREALFQKLSIKSRVGLVLFAIKNKIVQMS
jgi:DNA-binding NarL/FixJ family response regulator